MCGYKTAGSRGVRAELQPSAKDFVFYFDHFWRRKTASAIGFQNELTKSGILWNSKLIDSNEWPVRMVEIARVEFDWGLATRSGCSRAFAISSRRPYCHFIAVASLLRRYQSCGCCKTWKESAALFRGSLTTSSIVSHSIVPSRLSIQISLPSRCDLSYLYMYLI
ncbi:hypothetical protein EJ02DRAFT_232222 [Clathrospora elynae]|uniref:Uncharacterized protein n=1 Tax=Clathrospora elynae TaxID=706981 RepID=A0A6A5SL25_9PLEO|nr:hypothetical protein EJ02DRAFT_232222 [Clathrospora elynae]